MTELDLCSYVALAVVLYGMATPVLRTTHATDHGIMTYGLTGCPVNFWLPGAAWMSGGDG